MEPKANQKGSSVQIVQSVCSCPSCDSLECFSLRYNRDLKKCSCSKCSLTNCRYLSKTPSIHKITHGSSTKFHISEDDIATIEESVRKDTGYGEIKDKIYKDHKDRLIIRKHSTKTKTKLKESLSADNHNRDVKNVSSCSKSNGFSDNSISSCNYAPSNTTCNTDCKLNMNSKTTSSHNVIENNKDISDFPSSTNSKVVREGNSKFVNLPKKAYKVYQEVTTNTQTTTTVKKPSIITFKPVCEDDKNSNGCVSLSSIKCGARQEKLHLNGEQVLQHIAVNGPLSAALNLNTENCENTKKKSGCAAKVKEFKAFPSKEYMKALTKKKENNETKSFSTSSYKVIRSDILPRSTCYLIQGQNRDTNEVTVPENNNKDYSIKTTSVAMLEDIKNRKNLIKSTDGNKKDDKVLPPCVTYRNEQRDTNDGSLVNQNTWDPSSCTICPAVIHDNDLGFKSYKTIKEDYQLPENLPSHKTCDADQYKHANNILGNKDLLGREKNENECQIRDKEGLSSCIVHEVKKQKKTYLTVSPCAECKAILEQIKDTKEFPSKSYKVTESVREDQKNSKTVIREDNNIDVVKEKAIDTSKKDQNKNTAEHPSYTTCRKVLDQNRDPDNFPPKSYNIVQEEREHDKNFQQTSHEVIRKCHKVNNDFLTAKQNVNICKSSSCASVSSSTMSKAKDENKAKLQTSEMQKLTPELVREHKDQPNKFSTKEQNKINDQTQESKHFENEQHDFPHKPYCVVKSEDRDIKDVTSYCCQEENKEICGNFVAEQKNHTSDAPLSTASRVGQTLGTKCCSSNSQMESNKKQPSNTTCEALLEQKLTSSRNQTSNSSCKLIIEQTFSTGTKGVPSTCKAILKHTHTSDAKDFPSFTTCTTVHVISSNQSIPKHLKGLKESPSGTKSKALPENDIVNTKNSQQENSKLVVSSEPALSICNKISSCCVKCNAVEQPKHTCDSRPEKRLTKQDIYNRIIEAYQNCNCKVCECIVTLNETITPKSSEISCCKACEGLKDTGFSDRKYRKNQSMVMLSAVTDSKDFCSCEPCDCVMCKPQNEQLCNCTPCECIQCLGLSYKKEATKEEIKACECITCQCEDCIKENSYPESVSTHEISTGPDAVKQQCDCALCSYHFWRNQVTHLENESCECDGQNKFMRKPNSRCYHDYDIRPISIDTCNNKAKLLSAKIPLHISSSSQLDEMKMSTNIFNELCNASSYDETHPDHFGKVESLQATTTNERNSDFSKNISNQSNANSSKDETIFNLEVTAQSDQQPKQHENLPKKLGSDKSGIYSSKSSELVDIQNCTGICHSKSHSSVSKERLSQLEMVCNDNILPPQNTKPQKISPTKDYQIYNIKHYTIKHNSSKLTDSSRNIISMGSSKLVQTIIYEICHEMVENMFMEATKEAIFKLESRQKFKSVTVLKDVKTKSEAVFSELSVQIVPTDNKSEEELAKLNHPLSHTPNNQKDLPKLKKNSVQESTIKINEESFSENGPKKKSAGPTFNCNFCVVDKSLLNYEKYANGDQSKNKTKTCDFEFAGAPYLRYPTVTHATKISRPDFPLKYYSRVNPKSLLDHGSQISIHDSNNFEYYNNIFELQVYNIRLENTLKKAKTFSMELMKMLHKFEKANKSFKSLSKKMHPIPSELQKESDEEDSTSKKILSDKTTYSSQNAKRCSSPIQKIKTCFKCKSTKESKYDKENKHTFNAFDKTSTNRGHLVCESNYSECIIYDERLDKNLSSPYTMKRKDNKANREIGDLSVPTTDKTSRLLKAPIGRDDVEDNIVGNTSYKVLVSVFTYLRRNFVMTKNLSVSFSKTMSF